MSDTENARLLAARWREETGRSGGLVVVWAGEVQGWTSGPDVVPESWLPGSLGIEADGSAWRAEGGDAQQGAERWERLGEVVEIDLSPTP